MLSLRYWVRPVLSLRCGVGVAIAVVMVWGVASAVVMVWGVAIAVVTVWGGCSYCYCYGVVLCPDPTLSRGKGSGDH